MSEGRFKKVSTTDATGDKKPWFEPGKYFVEIQKVTTRDGRKGELWFIVEAKVVTVFHTTHPEKMKEGSIYSQTINFNKDMGPVNAKRFVLAAMGYDPSLPENNDEVDEEVMEFVVDSEQNPLAGTQMELECTLIKTKAGGDFTKYTWGVAETDDEEEEEGAA